MSTLQDAFGKANYRFRKTDHAQWHRQLSKQHILRSQLGFNEVPQSQPKACQGCAHYHGIAYGSNKATRTLLICAMHPYGWSDSLCPDWQDPDWQKTT